LNPKALGVLWRLKRRTNKQTASHPRPPISNDWSTISALRFSCFPILHVANNLSTILYTVRTFSCLLQYFSTWIYWDIDLKLNKKSSRSLEVESAEKTQLLRERERET
jgi:hypothetical protein